MNVPNGRTEVNETFGIPGNEDSTWYKRNIISVILPFSLLYNGQKVIRARFHYKAAPALLAAFNAVWIHVRILVKQTHGYDLTSEEYDNLSHQYLKDQGLLDYGGTYEYRAIRGTTDSLSMHSYGIAIDLAPGKNSLGSTTTSLPAWYIKCFTDQGFFWGGNFKNRKDPMHFQYATGV